MTVASMMAVVAIAPGHGAMREAAPQEGRGVSSPADLIVHGATVYTADPAKPRATALAVKGGRLVVVGSDDEALAHRGPATRVIDAHGATIVPGLHDAHGHFTALGDSLRTIDLRGTTSIDEIAAKVRERAARSAPGEWIIGRSWDQNDWPEQRWPTHADLDAASGGRPVYLTRIDGHAAWANTRALAIAGITAATPDPPGGRLIRDEQGRPTGVLIDRAMSLVASHIPPRTREQTAEAMRLADRECRRLGLTMVHDAGVSGDEVDVYRELVDRRELATRIYAMLRMPLPALRAHLQKGPLIGYADHRLTVRAVKISADGALGSRGAALLEPYADEPGTRGLLLLSPEELHQTTFEAAKAGFQVCVHAIGDAANRLVMDTFERVQREIPGSRALRFRNEHAQILNPREIPRFAALDVIASMQPTHCTSDMPWVPDRIGAERTRAGAYVWRRLLETGAMIAAGSDFPVEEANPLLGFYAAITRQRPDGTPPGGWVPDQRMTRDEALAAFTRHAAYAAHLERELGTLTPGKLADFVALDRDIMTVPAAGIPGTRVLRTVIAGEVVYEAAAEGTSR